MTICHATSSESNPYVAESPNIGNNGDLKGGHLNHTGPVYPAADWGDIIPPYAYEDEKGQLQVFPGYNWGPEGQAIHQTGCNVPSPPDPPGPKPVTPTLQCVDAVGGGTFVAHLGYVNPNATTVEPPGGLNKFSPGDPDRGQPKAFAPGSRRGRLPGHVGRERAHVVADRERSDSFSRHARTRCAGGSITVFKRLTPEADPGLFDLKIDGQIRGDGAGVSTVARRARSPSASAVTP